MRNSIVGQEHLGRHGISYWIDARPPSGRGYVPSLVLHLNCEAFTAGAVRDCIRIGDFEASFLQVFAVIEDRATDEKRALWINNKANVCYRHEDIPLLWAIHQVHDVLQAGASAADHRQTQRPVWFAFLFK